MLEAGLINYGSSVGKDEKRKEKRKNKENK